jgi:N-acyl-D-aspartate/D-glutamate deacylase
MTDFDLVIRGGNVIDGTGGPARTGDLAVKDGTIVEIGQVEGRGQREIDVDGALVTPGWVDIHTHYDGQATWDDHLAPSSWHGVTTVVMGNCGVGFAPVRPADHDRLISLMEGVEDIPGAALHEGLRWDWQSFPDYLDAVERRHHDVDVAAQVPHGAVRLYVMGDRGANREAASADEIAEMGRIAAAAVSAGALGFTTSRTLNHRTSTGDPTPTLTAAREELVGIAKAIGDTGKGVLQVVSDFIDFDDEVGTLRAMVDVSHRPLSISVAQAPRNSLAYRRILDAISEANADGLEMRAQVAARAIGILLGLQGSVNPLGRSATYNALADLPLAERVARLRDPNVKAAVLAEFPEHPMRTLRLDQVYELGEQPEYEPDPSMSVKARAERAGVDPDDLLYDLLLGAGGTALLYVPILNYADGNLDAVGEMLAHPHTVPGLSDGGAHVGTICDGSFPTTLLMHWGRDRTRGERFEVPWLVKRQTADTAAAVGLLDRGMLAPGYRADINVIDMQSLGLGAPHLVFDLPAGGKRLLQKATGYQHTFVAGEETFVEGEATGALPGRLVRGARPRPTNGAVR